MRGAATRILAALAQFAALLLGAALIVAPTARAHLGNISYGVFLNHFLLMWLLSWQAPLNVPQLVGLVVCSTLLSLFSFHYVENPVLQWRRHLRQH